METTSLVGRTIDGKYRLDELVGSGSMGTVYRATQLTLSKTVAIKVMLGDLVSEPTYASRFKREAKAASRMDHPNSLRVIDCGDDDGLLYIAMEFVKGSDLHTILSKEWPLATARIVDILSQTLAGLAVAHDMGIVHRDLKPENVMVVRGRDDEGRETEVVKVCDFGVAKLVASKKDDTQSGTMTGSITIAGSIIGTPAFMSPEQIIGEDLDARSDLYSLGVILYQVLTRRLPFEGKNPIELAMRHVDSKPIHPSTLATDVDAKLEAVCLKALSKRPEDRYSNAREMRAALRGVPYVPVEVPSPPVTTRAAPTESDLRGEPKTFSKAPTEYAPVSGQAAAPLVPMPSPSGTLMSRGGATEPSVAHVIAKKRRRLIALVAIGIAVGLLLLLAR